MDFDVLDIIAAIWAASFVACIVFALEILRSPRPEQSIAAWLLLFLFAAPFGAALYILLGRRKLRSRSQRKPPPRLSNLGHRDSLPISVFDALIRSYGLSPAADANKVSFCGQGDSASAAVVGPISSVESSIWVCTYFLFY